MFLHAAIVLALGAALADAQELTPGAIVDRVACRGNASQTYALYLPSSYSPDRRWPILYALDPGARGRLPVERFKDAAERLGFIVAGSNTSRNGPLEVSQAAISAMLADTAQRLALDARRSYITGFSGGARVAVMAAAAMQDGIAGVIGFGAGFPAVLQPSAAMRFAYFTAAGTDDFNYPELLALDRTAQRVGLVHRFLVFDGGHEWPPEGVCARALEWMELQAIRSGVRARDDALVQSIYAAGRADALSEEQAGRFHLAAARYAAVAGDLAGLHDVSDCQRRARELAQSRKAKDAEAALKDSVRAQEVLSSDLHRLILDATAGDEPLLATHELLSEVSRLRKQGESAKRPADRMAARRVLTSTWILLNDEVQNDFQRREFGAASTRLRVMTQIRPDNARVEVQLARAYVRAGDRRAGLDALQRAVAKGFTDADALEKEEDLAPLRGDAAFRAVLAKLRDK